VSALAAQPAQKHAHEHGGVQPVGLGPAVLARHGDARRVDDVDLNATGLQPPRQPEPVTSRLIGEGHPSDRPARLHRLCLPALQQPQQRTRIRLKLLQRLAANAGNQSGNQPARLAHLDHHDQTGDLVKGGERTAQVINLGHGEHPSVASTDDDAKPSPVAP